VSWMIGPRYIVFDVVPQERGFDWTADQLADALRSPLAAIGVRVVRHHGAGPALPTANFQARGWSRCQYKNKLAMVDNVVDCVMGRLKERSK
jgi:hypothetical protein